MCIDFTDVNKTCPKDCYPLLRIDVLVDSVMGYEILCFLDAFKGYHQIGMSEEDQEKIAFSHIRKSTVTQPCPSD